MTELAKDSREQTQIKCKKIKGEDGVAGELAQQGDLVLKSSLSVALSSAPLSTFSERQITFQNG